MPTFESNYVYRFFLHCIHKYKHIPHMDSTTHNILHASKCEKLCMRMYECIKYIFAKQFFFFFNSVPFVFPFFFSFLLFSFPNFMWCFFFSRVLNLIASRLFNTFCECICECIWMCMRAFCTRSLLADLLHHMYKIWAEQNCTRKHTLNRALIQIYLQANTCICSLSHTHIHAYCCTQTPAHCQQNI